MNAMTMLESESVARQLVWELVNQKSPPPQQTIELFNLNINYEYSRVGNIAISLFKPIFPRYHSPCQPF